MSNHTFFCNTCKYTGGPYVSSQAAENQLKDHLDMLCPGTKHGQYNIENQKGVKHDAYKIQVELISPLWLFGVGRVLTYGARKYEAHNWRKGLKLSRCIGAALRHIYAYLGGENFDPETGLHHLDHASCELMFVRELHETDDGTLDDRYKIDGLSDLLRDWQQPNNKPSV